MVCLERVGQDYPVNFSKGILTRVRIKDSTDVLSALIISPSLIIRRDSGPDGSMQEGVRIFEPGEEGFPIDTVRLCHVADSQYVFGPKNGGYSVYVEYLRNAGMW